MSEEQDPMLVRTRNYTPFIFGEDVNRPAGTRMWPVGLPFECRGFRMAEFELPNMPIPPVMCANGRTVSVQAGSCHYCTPRQNKGPWEDVEIMFMDGEVPELVHEWAEPSGDGFSGVCGYIPVEKVREVIALFGGVSRDCQYADEHPILGVLPKQGDPNVPSIPYSNGRYLYTLRHEPTDHIDLVFNVPKRLPVPAAEEKPQPGRGIRFEEDE